MTRSLLLIITCAIAALLLWHTGYYQQLPGIAALTGDDAATEQQLAVYIDQLERRHFDENGQLTRRIHTEQAFQYSNEPDIFYFTKPVFHIGSANDNWTGQSQQAVTNLATEQIVLSGDVVFHHSQNTARIRTQQLTIDNVNKNAFTTEPVELSSDRSRTTATGLHIDFDAQTLQLQNNVRTYFQPDTAGRPAAGR